MRHFALGSVLLLASAQLGLAATFKVLVGGGAGLKFVPETVNANVGDEIIFTFQQKNHSVTQSTLAKPCERLPGGFDTGFMPVPANQTNQTINFPQASLPVNQTTPIWVFCRQGDHCRQQMVFAVNPGSDFATFRANAAGSSPPTVSSATTPVPTTSAVPSSKDHKVVVGGPGLLAFNPTTVTAQPGDTVTFEFRQKNHTVTSSTFENPCQSNGGFDSGFQPVADGSLNFPTWVLPVNDTKPIWAYCKQGNHCTSGMVFTVNPTDTKTFTAFQNSAKQSGNSTSTTSPYGTGAAWRPSIGSSSIAVVLALSAAGWLL